MLISVTVCVHFTVLTTVLLGRVLLTHCSTGTGSTALLDNTTVICWVYDVTIMFGVPTVFTWCHVCVCVCVCVCLSVSHCVCIFECVPLCVWVCVHMCVCECVCLCVCVYCCVCVQCSAGPPVWLFWSLLANYLHSYHLHPHPHHRY